MRNPDKAVGESVDKFGTQNFGGYYYKNDDADADADTERIRNGWYWTGDLGYRRLDSCSSPAGGATESGWTARTRRR